MDASSLPFCWYLPKVDNEVFDDAETNTVENIQLVSDTETKLDSQVLLIDPITRIRI